MKVGFDLPEKRIAEAFTKTHIHTAYRACTPFWSGSPHGSIAQPCRRMAGCLSPKVQMELESHHGHSIPHQLTTGCFVLLRGGLNISNATKRGITKRGVKHKAAKLDKTQLFSAILPVGGFASKIARNQHLQKRCLSPICYTPFCVSGPMQEFIIISPNSIVFIGSRRYVTTVAESY